MQFNIRLYLGGEWLEYGHATIVSVALVQMRRLFRLAVTEQHLIAAPGLNIAADRLSVVSTPCHVPDPNEGEDPRPVLDELNIFKFRLDLPLLAPAPPVPRHLLESIQHQLSLLLFSAILPLPGVCIERIEVTPL
jgi:hypothetical protein